MTVHFARRPAARLARLIPALVGVLIAGSLSTEPAGAATSDASVPSIDAYCQPFILDFVTGSGQTPPSTTAKGLPALEAVSPQLGEVAEGELQVLPDTSTIQMLRYPALFVPNSLLPADRDITRLEQFGVSPAEDPTLNDKLEHLTSLKIINNYNASIDTGVVRLEALLTLQIERCPSSKIVLSGYSQGALVIDIVTQGWLADKPLPFKTAVKAIALLADPGRNPSASGIPDYPAVIGGRSASTAAGGICYWLSPFSACATPIEHGLTESTFAAETESFCFFLDAACDTSEIVEDFAFPILAEIYAADLCGVLCIGQLVQLWSQLHRLITLSFDVHATSYGPCSNVWPEVQNFGNSVAVLAAASTPNQVIPDPSRRAATSPQVTCSPSK